MHTFTPKCLLVTGACGFIGSNFVRYYLQEFPQSKIVNVDLLTYAGNPCNLEDIASQSATKSRYAFEHADIADAAAMERIITQYAPDAIINFAAESHVDRSLDDALPFIHSNVLGTQILLQCARKFAIKRFVHISTDEVYGTLTKTDAPFTEKTPLAPNSPYSASKASADLLVRAAVESYGLPAVITRCSNNYGPYQFPEKLIPLMFTKAMKGEALPVYGTGDNVRDWIYVLDHCRGIALALHHGKDGAIYNFGGHAETSNLDVVKNILHILGKPESLISFVKDRPGHDKRYAMDYSFAEKELGYAPLYRFENGLAETLNWYQQNGAWLNNVASGAYRDFMKRWYSERA